MNEVRLNFMHPTDGRVITVEIDSGMTAQEAVNNLITNNFVPQSSDGYQLALKGGATMTENMSFKQLGAQDNDTIRIIPATDAGNKTLIK